MKSFHRVVLSLLVGAGPLSALAQSPASAPTPYPDPNTESAWPGQGPIRFFPSWMPQLRATFWTQRDADHGKIIFVGDSIIGGWKLENDFAGKPVANRGIGGDVTRGLLFRLQEDVLDLNPRAIVIHIGGNDISADAEVDTIVGNYKLILQLIQKSRPETQVFVLAVLPRGLPMGDKAMTPERAAYLQKAYARIPQLNAQLQKLAAAHKNVTYVDSYAPFLLPDGRLDASLYNADEVHPTAAGRSKLGVVVNASLTKLNLL